MASSTTYPATSEPTVCSRDDTQAIDSQWHVAITELFEHIEARIRAKVEHPFRVIKRQFGHMKVR